MKRPALPAMPLCNGCGDCCGPAAARPQEQKAIRRYLKDTGESWQPAVNPLTCGFLRRQDDGSGRCAIYPVRPFPCQAFGVIAEMTCSHFPEAVKTSITPTKAVLMRWMDPEDKLLGEVFGPPNYLDRLLQLESPAPVKPGLAAQMLGDARASGELQVYADALERQKYLQNLPRNLHNNY